jgi:FMN phosphatase YigB (HAD superfamily)
VKKIEKIIFDFGGVFYDISFERLMKAFSKLKIPESLWENKSDNLFISLEKGQLSGEKFLKLLQLAIPAEVSLEKIEAAFNRILVGMPVENVRYLRRFKKHYPCYLLSNTNEIHYAYFHREIMNNPLTKEFYSSFEKEYYSHLMHMRKPDLKIYEAVLNDSKLIPETTLFVDDMEQNILAAKQLGLQVFQFGEEGHWDELIQKFNLQV